MTGYLLFVGLAINGELLLSTLQSTTIAYQNEERCIEEREKLPHISLTYNDQTFTLVAGCVPRSARSLIKKGLYLERVV